MRLLGRGHFDGVIKLDLENTVRRNGIGNDRAGGRGPAPTQWTAELADDPSRHPS